MIQSISSKWFFQMLFIFTFSLFMVSCESKAGKDPKEVAEEQNNEIDKQTEEDLNKERDEDFLIKATEMSMEDIQLGQLAQQKGTHADIKALANKMVEDHGKAMADVTALAARKTIAIPTATTDRVKNAYDKLNEKAVGNDFDREYCDMMVKGHKDAIDAFEKAANNAYDADIKAWASSMLPGLRMHLEHAMACEEKLKDMK